MRSANNQTENALQALSPDRSSSGITKGMAQTKGVGKGATS